MKKHLILMAAMISLGITNNCEAQSTEQKDMDEVCEKAEDCKSNVCTDKKCAQRSAPVSEQEDFSKRCDGVYMPEDLEGCWGGPKVDAG